MDWINRVLTKAELFSHREPPLKVDATIEVLNNQIVGFSVEQIKRILKRKFDIHSIVRSQESYLDNVSDCTKLWKNDIIEVTAFERDLNAMGALLGRLQRKQC